MLCGEQAAHCGSSNAANALQYNRTFRSIELLQCTAVVVVDGCCHSLLISRRSSVLQPLDAGLRRTTLYAYYAHTDCTQRHMRPHNTIRERERERRTLKVVAVVVVVSTYITLTQTHTQSDSQSLFNFRASNDTTVNPERALIQHSARQQRVSH